MLIFSPFYIQASIAFTSPGSQWLPFREKKGYTPNSIITEKDSTKKTPNKQTWRGKVCSTIVLEQRWIGKTSTEAETITSNAIKGRIWNRDRKGDGPIGHTAFSNAKIRRTNGRTDVSLETL